MSDHNDFFRLIAHLAGLGLVDVWNARGEFACNSSSSHSIVVIPDGTDLSERSEGGQYGWDAFTLTSSTSKIRYLAAMLSGNPQTKELAASLRSELSDWSKDDYVDHQSVLSFPSDRNGVPNEEFLRDVAMLLQMPEIAVLGGNDNGGRHPLVDNGVTDPLRLPDSGDWVLRKDTSPDGLSWWVLFSREDGTKLRLRLDGATLKKEGLSYVPEKSQAPELVDVKVTDRCIFERDCGYCYMSSSRDGVEGDPVKVMNLVASLAEMGVFEVAFGGGEPTLWPHMEEIMRFCRSVGVVPNFTTKNYSFFKRNPELLELAGAVAVSVNDEMGLVKLQKAVSGIPWWEGRDKVSVQVIPEIVPTETLQKIVAWADQEDHRITFLGYKTTGRGGDFDGRIERPNGFWIDLVKEYPSLRVAIDTVLALNCKVELEAAGVPSWCYHTEEGKFSMYVDAVRQKVGASSYVSSEEMEDVELSSGALVLKDALLRSFEEF